MTERSSPDSARAAIDAAIKGLTGLFSILRGKSYAKDHYQLEVSHGLYNELRDARDDLMRVRDSQPAQCSAGTSPDSAEYTNEQIALRMDQTYEACGDRWFKIAADRLRATQPAVPRKWDEGEHEGCGIDSQRALERQSRLSAGDDEAATPSMRKALQEIADKELHSTARADIWMQDKARAALRGDPAQPSTVTEEDWRDDPASDERWNAGLDFAMEHLYKFLGVNPREVNWDAATETLDGDVMAVIGNVLRAKFGEDWGHDDDPRHTD